MEEADFHILLKPSIFDAENTLFLIMGAVFAKLQDETFQVTQGPVYQNSTMLQP